MLTLYLNTVTREWFDADGNSFRDGYPQFAYLTENSVQINLRSETPANDDATVDVTQWVVDSSFASISGIGALLTIDNDYVHKLKGELLSEVSAGSVSSVTATIDDANYAKIPSSGVVRLFDAFGNYESLAYNARSIEGASVTFTTSGTVTGTYAVGATVDCDQAPYCSATLKSTSSDWSKGRLLFDLVVDSERLREEMAYNDTARLTVRGLELLIFKTSDGADVPIVAYLCDTAAVTGLIGSVGYEAAPPDAMQNKISGVVDQLIAAETVSGGAIFATANTLANSAGSAAVVSALSAVASSGYATSAAVLPIVSAGGYATNAAVSSVVSSAVAGIDVPDDLADLTDTTDKIGTRAAAVVSSGGYTTSATVSSMINTAIEGLPSGGTGDGLTSAQASSIAISAVSSAGYVLSAGVVPIVSAGGYTTSATVSSIAATSANAAKTAAITSALTSVSNSGYATSSAVSAIVSAGNFVASAAVLPIVSAGGYTTSATVSGMISTAINEIPSGGGGTDSAAVHIYSASIGADGMVTISGGAVTIPSLAIGDEITSGGRLWRKARQEAVVYTTSTVVSSAGGTPNSDVIIVSGAGTEIVNGTYNIVDSTAVETARIWKHESAQLWISWDSIGVAGWYLGCSYSQAPGVSDAYYIQATPTGGFIDPPDAVWSSGLFEGGGASPMPTVAYGTNPAVNSNVLVVSGAGTTSVNGLYNLVDSSASGQARVWSNSENNLVVKFDSNETYSWFIGSSGAQAGYKEKYMAPNFNVADPVGLTWQTNNGSEDPPPTVEFMALPGTSSTIVTSSVESAHIAVFNELIEAGGRVVDTTTTSGAVTLSAGVTHEFAAAGLSALDVSAGDIGASPATLIIRDAAPAPALTFPAEWLWAGSPDFTAGGGYVVVLQGDIAVAAELVTQE